MRSIKEDYRNFLNTSYGAQLYNSFKLVLYGEEDSLVQTLNNSYLQNLPLLKKASLSVCDIGGGDGNRIIHILIFLHDKYGIRFRLDFIEQSKQYIEAFDDSKIKSFGETSLFHSLFEEVDLQRKYDLIFLIHSIFAFHNGNAIDKVLSLPNAEGKVVIVSNDPASFLAGLKYLVDEGYTNKRYEIDQLERDLENRQITFNRFQLQTKWTIDHERFESDMNTLLQWISLGKYNSFNNEKKIMISEYIASKSERIGNRTFFCENEVILLIPPII